jgi:hypothetical protein
MWYADVTIAEDAAELGTLHGEVYGSAMACPDDDVLLSHRRFSRSCCAVEPLLEKADHKKLGNVKAAKQ